MRKLLIAFVGLCIVLSPSLSHAQSKNVSQSGAQSGSASGAQANLYAGNNQSYYPQNTPPATAPAFVTASPCMGAVSAGGSSPVVSITVGMSYKDSECEARSNADILNRFGLHDASIQELCGVQTIADAMQKAGTPCSSFNTAPNQAVSSVSTTTETVAVPGTAGAGNLVLQSSAGDDSARPGQPAILTDSGSPSGQQIYRPAFCTNGPGSDPADQATYNYYCNQQH